MKTSYRLSAGVITVTTFLLLLISVAASTDDSLARIANYKQWSKVSHDLAKDTYQIDPNSVGG